MDYFGDVSGHFRGLLEGECDVAVVGVVAGDRISCGRCAKQAVRRIDDIPEARWNDIMEVQKRRLYDCFSEQDYLEFGYGLYTREMLHSMDNYHRLYQDDLPLDWDLALTGYAYGEILYEMGVPNERNSTFTFDRVASKPQTKAVAEHIEDYVQDVSVFSEGSRQSSGIQSADCLAGGIAEDRKRDTTWLDTLHTEDVTEVTYNSLLKLESELMD